MDFLMQICDEKTYKIYSSDIFEKIGKVYLFNYFDACIGTIS